MQPFTNRHRLRDRFCELDVHVQGTASPTMHMSKTRSLAEVPKRP